MKGEHQQIITIENARVLDSPRGDAAPCEASPAGQLRSCSVQVAEGERRELLKKTEHFEAEVAAMHDKSVAQALQVRGAPRAPPVAAVAAPRRARWRCAPAERARTRLVSRAAAARAGPRAQNQKCTK